MKNTDIHNGLERKEIRDFLSMTQVELWTKRINNKKRTIEYKGQEFAMEWGILDAEAQLEYDQENLNILKNTKSIIDLIAVCGWQEFDVSDETKNDTGHTLCMHFIGTQKEYISFKHNMKKKKQ